MLEKLENLLLRNITILSLVFIIIILLLDLIPFFYFKQYNFLSTSQTITFIWAILAFLYWYKKYERDKNIELLNLISYKKDIYDIIQDWKNKKYLFEKYYINDFLFNIYEEKYIESIIFYFNSVDNIEISSLLSYLLNDKKNYLYFIKIFEKIKLNYEIMLGLEKMIKNMDYSKIDKLKDVINLIDFEINFSNA